MDAPLFDLTIDEIYSVNLIHNDTGARLVRNDRDCWAIVYKYEGETVYTVGDRQYISDRDSIILLPSGSDYRWVCTAAGHCAIIDFKCELEIDGILQYPVGDGDEFLKIFRRMEARMLSGDRLAKMSCIRDAYSILLKLWEQGKNEYTSSEKSAKLLPAVEHIFDNYMTDLCNDDLAALTGYSTVYFRKLFTSVYGVSPIEYVKRLRIKKAKEMLGTDHGSITDIALSIGYQSIFDFSRDFRKHTGTTPSAYSKKCHANTKNTSYIKQVGKHEKN